MKTSDVVWYAARQRLESRRDGSDLTLQNIQVRHLNVEHQEFGPVRRQGFDSLRAIFAFGEDLNVRLRTEHEP